MPKHFFVANFVARVSSGTYIRSIANMLGERISIPSLAFSIKRTKVGKYSI
jgi:tRNA U55 pseudouridine synthase TruB